MRFAIVTRDELWEPNAMREERLSYGEAITRGTEIVATDTLDQELLRIVEQAVPSPNLRGEGGRVVVSARRTGDPIITEFTIVVSAGDFSIVTTPEHLAGDLELLRKVGVAQPETPIDYRQLPLVWRHGSGAVLLHEAAGHPAEHRKERVEWPRWLAVTDEPAFATDDTGRATRTADLLRGEEPSAMRRASFSDVPLTRLSNVVVRQSGAPFDFPQRRIDVMLIGGGNYDPLTDAVTIRVTAADLIDGATVQRIEPFTIAESRVAVARAIRGAAGATERYPGVICSTEGQEIAVGSHAPLLLTRF